MHELVIKELKNVSTHGVSIILMEETKLMKVLWSLLLTIAWILCIYCIATNISDYFKYDVITSIDTVIEKPFKFPAVTFCNYDPSGYYEFSSEEFIDIKKSINNETSYTIISSVDSALDYLF